VLCIAASDYQYFVTYFFSMYCIIIAVCLWNALVVLPILVSYIAPPAYQAEDFVNVPSDSRKPISTDSLEEALEASKTDHSV
jgi:hypothetical protein